MQLKIKINMENEAFDSDPGVQVASILRMYCRTIEQSGLKECKLFDVNGNTVGYAKLLTGEADVSNIH